MEIKPPPDHLIQEGLEPFEDQVDASMINIMYLIVMCETFNMSMQITNPMEKECPALETVKKLHDDPAGRIALQRLLLEGHIVIFNDIIDGVDVIKFTAKGAQQAKDVMGKVSNYLTSQFLTH